MGRVIILVIFSWTAFLKVNDTCLFFCCFFFCQQFKWVMFLADLEQLQLLLLWVHFLKIGSVYVKTTMPVSEALIWPVVYYSLTPLSLLVSLFWFMCTLVMCVSLMWDQGHLGYSYHNCSNCVEGRMLFWEDSYFVHLICFDMDIAARLLFSFGKIHDWWFESWPIESKLQGQRANVISWLPT